MASTYPSDRLTPDQSNYKIMWESEKIRANDLQRKLDQAQSKDTVNLQKELFATKNKIDGLERADTEREIKFKNLEAFNKRLIAKNKQLERLLFLEQEVRHLEAQIEGIEETRSIYLTELLELREQRLREAE